jgi:hypothetical protein
MANQVQKCCRANFDDRPLTRRLPSKKARPAQNHPIGPKCVSPDSVVLDRAAVAAAVPGLDAGDARLLVTEAASRRGALRQLDRHLAAFPGALASGSTDAPKAVIALAGLLAAAGYPGIGVPACQACGRSGELFPPAAIPGMRGLRSGPPLLVASPVILGLSGLISGQGRTRRPAPQNPMGPMLPAPLEDAREHEPGGPRSGHDRERRKPAFRGGNTRILLCGAYRIYRDSNQGAEGKPQALQGGKSAAGNPGTDRADHPDYRQDHG